VLIEKKVVKHESLTLSGASTPPTETMYVYAQRDMVPNDLKIEATLTYQQVRDEKKMNPQTASGSLLRTNCNSTTMPTSFFLRLIEPQKDNMDNKIQFSMVGMYALGPLPEVFAEMFDAQRCDESFKQRRNISFQYHDGAVASVLVSKDEKKIRLQTSDLHHQWLLVKEFIDRLEENYRNTEIYDVITFDQQIPLNDLFATIDEHFEIRNE